MRVVYRIREGKMALRTAMLLGFIISACAHQRQTIVIPLSTTPAGQSESATLFCDNDAILLSFIDHHKVTEMLQATNKLADGVHCIDSYQIPTGEHDLVVRYELRVPHGLWSSTRGMPLHFLAKPKHQYAVCPNFFDASRWAPSVVDVSETESCSTSQVISK